MHQWPTECTTKILNFKVKHGVRGVAQQLRAPDDLPENWVPIPNTQPAASCDSSSKGSSAYLGSLPKLHIRSAQKNMQAEQSNI